jgi:hypothetical protein
MSYADSPGMRFIIGCREDEDRYRFVRQVYILPSPVYKLAVGTGNGKAAVFTAAFISTMNVN